MEKSLVLLFTFVLHSFVCSSQELIFKEYVKQSRSNRQTFITHVSDSSKERNECPVLSNIWGYADGKYYSIANKTVRIINDRCEVVDSVVFEERVIDVAVRANLMIVSITNDEVEYYSSRIFMVDLTNKSKAELNISSSGVKFGLNISENGELLSFIHEDEANSVQKLMIYARKNGNLIEVDEQIKELSSFGDVGFPAQSCWLGDHLYYATSSDDFKNRFLLCYDVWKSHQKLRDLPSSYSFVFKITDNGKNMIVLKREDHRYRYIVSVDIKTGVERLLYAANEATLSDLDSFEYVEE